MPCTSGGPSHEQTQEARYIPALLCAIMTVIESRDAAMAVLDAVNWQEAGVHRAWFESWWAAHKEQDRRRREQEARNAEIRRTQTAALAKLSDEERAALGIRLF